MRLYSNPTLRYPDIMGWEALANLFVSPGCSFIPERTRVAMGLRLSVILGGARLSGMGPYDLRHEGRAKDLQREGRASGLQGHILGKTVPPLPPCPLAMVPPGPHIHRGSLKTA